MSILEILSVSNMILTNKKLEGVREYPNMGDELQDNHMMNIVGTGTDTFIMSHSETDKH